MKRLIPIIATVLVLGAASEAGQTVPQGGVVVESMDKGSALDRAGARPGDVLISWTRAETASKPPVRGDFHTPFDAREFEIEQLPRGGTTITISRDGRHMPLPLIAGFWGATVRPSLSPADLKTYAAGLASEKDRPDEALSAWRELTERRSTGTDVVTAAWLLTRAGSAFVALDNLERAGEVFEHAAGMFRTPNADPWLEAMVWEAEGRACLPELSARLPAGAKPVTRPRLEVGLRAHEKATALRTGVGRVLAAAESELLSGVVVTTGTPRVFVESSPEDRALFQRAGARLEHALTVIVAEAPQGFAHGRALIRRSAFIGQNWGPRSSDAVTIPQAIAAKQPGYRDARAIFESVAPTHQLHYTALEQLYATASSDRRLADAEGFARRIIEYGERAGDRVALDFARRSLASVLARSGRLPDALAIVDDLRKTAADPSSIPGVVIDIAIETNNRGATDEAIRVLEELLRTPKLPAAIEIRILNTITPWYSDRGDFAAAEQAILRLLGQVDEKHPAFLGVMLNQANLAAYRGDFASSDSAAARGLAAAERGSSGSKELNLRMQVILNDFRSGLASNRGDADAAVRFIERAIAVSALEPGREDDKINRQLRLASYKGDSARVLELSLEDLAVTRRSSPGTSSEAISLHNAALAHIERDEYDKALPYLREALALNKRLAPEGLEVPVTLKLLGLAEGTTGDRKAGIAHLEEAIALLEDRRRRPGAGTSWGGMADSNLPHVHFYTADLLVQDGQLERAFNILERSRARGLLGMLATRQMRVSASVPPELLAERRRLEGEYNAKQLELAGLNTAVDAQVIDAARGELHNARLRLNDLDRRVADADPRAAALENPAPLTLSQARASLDPGTVLLSYLVGPYRTYLFVVSPLSAGSGGNGLAVYPIAIAEPDLRKRVRAFQNLIEWDADPKSANRAELLASGRTLYDQLVRPAELQLAAASRVLLSLDEPLHALPFAALVRGDAARPQYLTQWKPLHTTPSMSVYAELQRTRRPANPAGPIVVFADPKYPVVADQGGDAAVQALVRSGTTFTPLPGTQREASAIKTLFGAKATTYVGGAATEGRATAVGASARLIHIAVHGVLDERLPLNSALAFTIPDRQAPGEPNGLLQAWEIFEHMRIDADLVTLSACESGRGQEVTGEGLVGLSRAFLYAGARTVAASLWKVADDPTAELMNRFYTELRNGKTKDQALRNAQMALMGLGRKPGSKIDYSSPAHWAAFALTGDWK